MQKNLKRSLSISTLEIESKIEIETTIVMIEMIVLKIQTEKSHQEEMIAPIPIRDLNSISQKLEKKTHLSLILI